MVKPKAARPRLSDPGSARRGESLERAPRRVPWSVRVPALTGGFFGLFGWIWLTVSSIIVVSMGVHET